MSAEHLPESARDGGGAEAVCWHVAHGGSRRRFPGECGVSQNREHRSLLTSDRPSKKLLGPSACGTHTGSDGSACDLSPKSVREPAAGSVGSCLRQRQLPITQEVSR